MKNRVIICVILLCVIVGGIYAFDMYKQTVEQQGNENPAYTKEQLQEMKEKIKADLPKMDGSTSTIPLEAGIRASLYNITQEKAEAQVVHSTTYGSFTNLINKDVDVIFSTPLSQEQYQMAKNSNMELELVPIAKEAFVFVVNASNPVDSLTKEQLKDIYSGKITNWSQVGGNDEEIVAYQRNATSGSQNYMIEFMGDTKLMEPITDFIPQSMVGLMDAIAVYDNAENAIGYSVYAYAADMYGNGNEIKFIKVDGVEPTKKTMASGEYPLLNYNYAIFDKATPQDSTIRLLVEWLLTDEGQLAVSNAGYIPVKNVAVSESKMEIYNKKGTGKQKDANYQRADQFYTYAFEYGTHIIDGESNNVHLTQLANLELQSKINQFIDSSINEIEQKAKDTFKGEYIIAKEGEEFSPYSISPKINVFKECMNGYLGIHIYLPYDYEVGVGKRYSYYSKTAVYDLYTGKQLQFSDLFYKDTDFIQYINEELKRQVFAQYDMGVEVQLKRDFVGLPNDFDFILTGIIFERENPFFADGEMFEYSTYFDDVCAIYQPRDMKGIFVDDSKIYQQYFETNGNRKYEQIIDKENKIEYNLQLVDTKNPTIDEDINNYIKNWVLKNFDKQYIDKNYNITEDLLEYDENYGFDTDFTIYGTEKVVYRVYSGNILDRAEKLALGYNEIVIDLKKGQIISETISGAK